MEECKVAGSTKINTPPWLFFTFFKLYKWNQIVQHTTYFFIEEAAFSSEVSLVVWFLFKVIYEDTIIAYTDVVFASLLVTLKR